MVVHGGRIHTDHDRRLPHTHTLVHRNSTGDNNGPQNTLCSAISTGFGTRRSPALPSRLLLLLFLLLRSWQHQAHSLSTNDGTSINPDSLQTHRLPVHEVVTDAVPVLDPIWLPASIPFGHTRMCMCTRASSASSASSTSLLLLLYSTTRNTRMNHSNCEAFVFSFILLRRLFHRRFHHHHRLFVEPTDALYLWLLCSLSVCYH